VTRVRWSVRWASCSCRPDTWSGQIRRRGCSIPDHAEIPVPRRPARAGAHRASRHRSSSPGTGKAWFPDSCIFNKLKMTAHPCTTRRPLKKGLFQRPAKCRGVAPRSMTRLGARELECPCARQGRGNALGHELMGNGVFVMMNDIHVKALFGVIVEVQQRKDRHTLIPE
jgi:hypothetical protein